MNMNVVLGQTPSAWPVTHDLSNKPKAFKLAYGPQGAFPDDIAPAAPLDISPLPYRGRRPTKLRSRASCSIQAVLPDLATGKPRLYGCESQLELHNLALTLVDPEVQQVIEQHGPIPFRDADGLLRSHFFDLLILYKDGRRVGVAVKPEERLISGKVLRDLRQLRATMPLGLLDEVRLVTEHSFLRSKAQNALMYLRFKMTPEPEADARFRETVQATAGATSIANLIRRSRTGHCGFRAAVRAIFEGHLSQVSDGQIDLFTIVEVAR